MSKVPNRAIDPLSGLVTEAQWQQTVIDAAELYDWWVFHDHDSRRNRAGFPDLVLIKPPRVMFLELKREKGRVSPAQHEVLTLLDGCETVETHVARPSQWSDVCRWLS